MRSIGSAGNAISTATGTGETGYLQISSYATSYPYYAGNGGNTTAIASGNTGGYVQTSSQAYSYQFGAALARATSTGSAGNPDRSTDSYANSSGGIITSLALHSSDVLNSGNNGAGTDVAETRANVAAAAPTVTNSDGKQACLFATGSPLTADSNAVLAGNPNASNNFQPGGASVMLGLMTLQSGYSSSSAGGVTQHRKRHGDLPDRQQQFRDARRQDCAAQSAGHRQRLYSARPNDPRPEWNHLRKLSPRSPSAMTLLYRQCPEPRITGRAASLFSITVAVTTDAPGDSFRAQMLFGTGSALSHQGRFAQDAWWRRPVRRELSDRRSDRGGTAK